ncbi:MAG: hypothetical protein ACOZQL_15985 [Myxococcota bacterium]
MTSFFELFDGAPPVAEERNAWSEVRDAHAFSRPLRVRLGPPTEGGWRVSWGGLDGLLRADAAPWTQPPVELDAWVLRYDLDRAVLEFIAFNPRTGP